MNTDDLISRKKVMQLARDVTLEGGIKHRCIDATQIWEVPSAQPQYEELTPEEAASEIASGSIMSAWYWLDDMIRLKQMGYAICRKR